MLQYELIFFCYVLLMSPISPSVLLSPLSIHFLSLFSSVVFHLGSNDDLICYFRLGLGW